MLPHHRAIGQTVLWQRIVGRPRYLFGLDLKLIGFATSNEPVAGRRTLWSADWRRSRSRV